MSRAIPSRERAGQVSGITRGGAEVRPEPAAMRLRAGARVSDPPQRQPGYIGAMHCPQCGKPISEQAVACQSCGSALDLPGRGAGASREMARTVLGVARPPAAMLGGPAEDPAPGGREPPGAPAQATNTIVGLPPVMRHAAAVASAGGVQGALGEAPAAEPPRSLKTQLGHSSPGSTVESRARGPAAQASPEAAPSKGAHADPRAALRADGTPMPPTLTSRADDGRAPPGRRDGRGDPRRGAPPERNGHEPPHELGATVVNPIEAGRAPAKRLKAHAVNIPRPQPPVMQRKIAKQNAARLLPRLSRGDLREGSQRTSKGVIAIVVGAAVLAVGAVLFVALWPGRSSVTARPAADAQGRDGIELTCSSCPDGTSVTIERASAQIAAGAAFLPLGRPLIAGDNRFKVRIDRPKGGPDETLPITVHLPYRIRPELSTLQGERPSIQVVVEAEPGARVTLDGKPIPLVGGRAVEAFDVIDACTGLTGEARSLSRQIPYVVTLKKGDVERGSVNVMVGIVPLEIDAPGSSVVIDGPSFVLAGRTTKGAELIAAGKPVPVKPDGSFAHVMNVSSIGATQIEVRAKLAGMAPRLTRIKVRRVDNLETAARDFASESPITYAALGSDIARQAGKAIVVAGQVLEVKRENHRTTLLLDVSSSAGCKGCSVQLVHGASNPAQPGDQLTAYGRVLRAARLPSGADVPEIEVDFTVKGLR